MAEEKFYTVKEASKLLGVSTRTLERYIKDGKIRSIIEKHTYLIPEEELIKISSSGETDNSDRETDNSDRETDNSDRERDNSDTLLSQESAKIDNSANSDKSAKSIIPIKKVLKVFPNGKVLDNSILRWAKKYVHKFGLPVIPVGIDKRPLIDWKEFRQDIQKMKN
jgi:excisionase family DNA binding protein